MIIYPLIRMQTFKENKYFILNCSAFVFLINPLDSIITSIANIPALSIGYYFIQKLWIQSTNILRNMPVN